MSLQSLRRLKSERCSSADFARLARGEAEVKLEKRVLTNGLDRLSNGEDVLRGEKQWPRKRK